MRRKRKQQKRLLEERLRDLQRLEAMEAAAQAEGEGLECAPSETGHGEQAAGAACSHTASAHLPRRRLEARGGQRLHLFFWLPPWGGQGWPLPCLLFPCCRGRAQPQPKLPDLRLLGLPFLSCLVLHPLRLLQPAGDWGPPVTQQ